MSTVVLEIHDTILNAPLECHVTIDCCIVYRDTILVSTVVLEIHDTTLNALLQCHVTILTAVLEYHDTTDCSIRMSYHNRLV